jgi:hypothetical protein
MKNKSLSQLSIVLGIAVGTLFVIDLGSLIAPAEASGCRPTGKTIGGTAVLRCSGRTKCRPTGRFKVIKGKRYAILRCPR